MGLGEVFGNSGVNSRGVLWIQGAVGQQAPLGFGIPIHGKVGIPQAGLEILG